MKLLNPCLLALAAATFLAGCATHTKEQLAAVRAANVSPAVMLKLESRGSLTPEDLIELHRRKVDDAIVIRHLNRHGGRFIIDKAAIKKLQAAKVSDAVIEAVIIASYRFQGRYSSGYYWGPAFGVGWNPYWGPWGPGPGPWFRDPWWPYGGPMMGPIGGPIGGPLMGPVGGPIGGPIGPGLMARPFGPGPGPGRWR